MLTKTKDLGMIYCTPQSKVKRRHYMVLCSGCGEEHRIQSSQFNAGFTEYCLECSKKKKRGELK